MATANDTSSHQILINITAVGLGVYCTFYTVASGKCRLMGSIVAISYFTSIGSRVCKLSNFLLHAGGTSGSALNTKVGAGVNVYSWPMPRKGGWIALESKTKAFVPNIVAFEGTGNPVGVLLLQTF